MKIALCGGAGAHRDVALKAMRQARDSIANDGAVTGAVTGAVWAQVLQQLNESIANMEKEATVRDRLARGELGLDIYKMREALEKQGLKYMSSADEI